MVTAPLPRDRVIPWAKTCPVTPVWDNRTFRFPGLGTTATLLGTPCSLGRSTVVWDLSGILFLRIGRWWCTLINDRKFGTMFGPTRDTKAIQFRGI